MHRYRSYARSKARPYFLAGSEHDDVVQEAMIGLFKAIRNYDLDQETPFRAFAELCISRQILTAVKSANRSKHSPLNASISLDAPAHSAGDDTATVGDSMESTDPADPAEMLTSAEAIEDLRDSLKRSLTDLEKGVLALYMEGKSHEEIAAVLGNHVKSIDNALQRIKRKVWGHLEDHTISR